MGISNRWYNDDIGKGIDGIPISTNILEHYDNVTYNIGLYMLHRVDQEKIDGEMYAKKIYDIDFSNYKKIIIAESGVTSKFSINSLVLNNILGFNSNETNIMSYKANIKLFESYGCNFANELGYVTIFCGYESYFERPIWLEIWFSGYNPVTGEQIGRIELPNGHNSILLNGHIGTVKNNINNMGTEWDIEFIPSYKSLINNTFNPLTVESVIKNNAGITLDEFMKSHVKNIYDKYIESFPLPSDSKKSIIGREYNNDPNQFIKINYYKVSEGYYEKSKNEINYDKVQKLTVMPELERNIGSIVDKNGTSSFKTDINMTFTSICQEFLHYSVNHKDYVARYYVRPKFKKYILNIPLFEYTVDIVLEQNEIIKYQLDILSQGNITVKAGKNTNLEDIKTQMFYKYLGNHTLCKKYQFAFSGEDTSVIEVMNKQEMLYYLPATYYDKMMNTKLISKYSLDGIAPYEIKIDESTYLENDLTEDVYLDDLYNNKDDSISESKLLYMIKMNDINDSQTLKNSSSTNKEVDDATIDSKILYKRFYKSGSMSSIKMSIYGDPYWMCMNAVNISPTSNMDDFNTVPNDEMIRNAFRFIFTLKTCSNQTNGLVKHDYEYEESIYVSGIYIMTECESRFENGKFTQNLTGVIDNSLVMEDMN